MPDIVFVSMPFGDADSPDNEWTKLYDFGLKPLEQPLRGLPDGIRHVPVRLWRADRNLKSLGLKENVIEGIERSTFVLCVLTTSVVDGSHGIRLTNPNVLWELGYADAIGKPIVVMTDNDSLRNLPILSGNRNVCIYNHKLVMDVKPSQAADVLRVIARDLAPFLLQASVDARHALAGHKK